jgi:hypothetical protein
LSSEAFKTVRSVIETGEVAEERPGNWQKKDWGIRKIERERPGN